MGGIYRGAYTIDEIDNALFSRGIPAITRKYVTTTDGEAVELEYVCFKSGRDYELGAPASLVFSAFWIWRDRIETRYQIIMDGKRRLLSGVIHEYEKRVNEA